MPPLAPPTAPTSAATPPATPPPSPVDVTEAVALIVGATEPLRAGEVTTVDPGASFRVVLSGRFPDARLSLLDAADAMVAGSGGLEAAASTTVTFLPAAPLRPGSPYRLRIDGAVSREIRSASGAARAPVEFHLLGAGEPPAQKSKPRKKRP